MATKQTLVVGELTAVDNTQAAFRSVQNSARKTQQAGKALNQQFRFVRGGAGQLGHQIQDVAVQLQMGTNAMIVFGQQGSQIASLMGPQGALVGAVLAVAAAIGVTLLNDTKKATDEMKKLSDELDKFIDKTKVITSEFAEFKKIVADDALEKQKERFAELTEEIELGERLLEGYKRQQELQNEGLNNTTDALGGAIAATVDYNAKIEEQTRLNAQNRAELSLLEQQINGVGEADRRAVNKRKIAAEQMLKASHAELDQIVKASQLKEARLQAEDKLRMSRLSQLHSINNQEMQILINKDKAEQELYDKRIERDRLELELRQAKTDNIIANANRELEAIIAAEEQKRQAKEAQMALDNQVMSSGQQLLGQIMAGMDQQSGAYKALFAAQQAVAIAQTIINTEAAAMAALAPVALGGLGPVAGAPYATMIRAMGYASAGLIAAQTVASFEGGGFTGPGARSGGIDGRGGFPAILHPNETVVDHRNGGGATVVQHINISTGVAQTVRAEILNLMPQIAESAKAAVADSRMRGGGYSKALIGM